MKTVALIQARMDSTRLPGKVLKDLSGKTVLKWVCDAAVAIPGVDLVIVATSDQDNDQPIVDFCASRNIECYRGSKTDVLARMALAAQDYSADVVLRITADCPLLDPYICSELLQILRHTGADYVSNINPPSWPDGMDCEVMSAQALDKAHELAQTTAEREHVTLYIRANQHIFSARNLRAPYAGLEAERWTLDDEADYSFLQALTAELDTISPPSWTQVMQVLQRKPEIYQKRSGAERNEGAQKSVATSPYISKGYKNSNALLERALKTVPLGSQTFSKSYIQYPSGQSPMILTHGLGGKVWDVDGNEYVDLVSGLLPNVLGYCDPDVDEAVRTQLDRGISFSLATTLEADLAERMVEIIPCAEKVRFGKNGTDATSAAIRLARAHTKRDHVIVCGYHGWQDWYIGSTTRHLGVPQVVRELTCSVAYNDLDAMRAALKKNETAAIIMEPMNVSDPEDGYLQAVKDLAHEHGALLVFDEVITGFRYHIGGAQAYFGVTPDLAAFGKGMGNGMPISAICGRADIMDLMNDIFYSGTFGGEALSLAASIAVIDKMRSEPVIEKLWQTGEDLSGHVLGVIRKCGLEEIIKLKGKAPWKVLAFHDHPTASKEAVRTAFLTNMLARGVLIGTGHNICYAHNGDDILRVVQAYEATLELLAAQLEQGNLAENLGAPPIIPIFQVRAA